MENKEFDSLMLVLAEIRKIDSRAVYGWFDDADESDHHLWVDSNCPLGAFSVEALRAMLTNGWEYLFDGSDEDHPHSYLF